MKIIDPIHGPISFEGELEPLRPLLATEPLRRLLHLEQNPFAGFVYAGATHTRFSHAVGTAHVAHELVRKTGITCDSLRIACLIAALLQDMGELPFEPALKRLFNLRQKSKADLVSSASAYIGRAVPAILNNLSTEKAWFTIALLYDIRECILDIEKQYKLDDLFKHVFWLLLGRIARRFSSETYGVCATILDSELDADRIDYVHRDSYHALGTRYTPDRILHAIQKIEENGTVLLNDVVAATDFLLLRMTLWNGVYQDPRVRLWVNLLYQIFRSIKHDISPNGSGHSSNAPFEMTLDDFLQFNDAKVWGVLTDLAADRQKRGRLSMRALKALDIFSSRCEYPKEAWLPEPEDPGDPDHGGHAPPDIFFEARPDVVSEEAIGTRHRLLNAEEVYVKIPSISGEAAVSPLEEACKALYAGVLDVSAKVGASDGIWIWVPQIPYHHVKPDELYRRIAREVRDDLFEIPIDTWKESGEGPRYFISYAFDDYKWAYRIARILHKSGARYKWFPPRGLFAPATPRELSEKAARECDVLVVVMTANYLERYRLAGSNVHAEVMAFAQRRPKRSDVRFLFFASFKEVEEFPFRDLGWDEPPLVEDLRGLSVYSGEFETAVLNLLGLKKNEKR